MHATINGFAHLAHVGGVEVVDTDHACFQALPDSDCSPVGAGENTAAEAKLTVVSQRHCLVIRGKGNYTHDLWGRAIWQSKATAGAHNVQEACCSQTSWKQTVAL
jgi:hypothetical protein